MESLYELMANPSFDSESLKRHLILSGELAGARSYAFSKAKEWRNDCPLAFVRVLKVSDVYFIITNEKDYKIYWEARKLALRNERKLKNETL